MSVPQKAIDPSYANARSQLRSSLFLAAMLRSGTEISPVRVRNMSVNGAMIEAPAAPPTGTTVDLLRGPLAARGTVVWSSDSGFGVRFSSLVTVKDWLAAPPTRAQQQQVDDLVALVKAGGADLLRDDDDAVEHRSNELLADDLSSVVRLLQVLEEDLSHSPETLGRHATALQNLDMAMQIVRAVVGRLTSDTGVERSRTTKLGHRRTACKQTLDPH